MKGYLSRRYQGIPVGLEIRRDIGKDKIFRIRHGNGHYGSILGERIHDKYDYIVPDSIKNSPGSVARWWMTEAVKAWQALSEPEKNEWRKLEKSYKGTTGYALFISNYIKEHYMVPTHIKDADGDTIVHTESTPDDDTIKETNPSGLVRQIHPDGIQDLLKQSRCHVSLGDVEVPIPNVTYTKVPFDVVEYDNQSEWGGVSPNRFTAKKAGCYSIKSHVGVFRVVAGVPFYLSVYVNGAPVKVSGIYSYDGTSSRIFVSTDLMLAANDYVEIWVYQNTGGQQILLTGTDTTWLAIHKLS